MERAVNANGGTTIILLPFIALTLMLLAAIVRPTLVIEAGIGDFLVITCAIAAWAAWRFGSAIAATWRPYTQVVLYALPFALVVRWVHYALFNGTLLSLHYYLIDLVVVLSLATLGYFRVRASQMVRQYHWLYTKKGLFSWIRAVPAEDE